MSWKSLRRKIIFMPNHYLLVVLTLRTVSWISIFRLVGGNLCFSLSGINQAVYQLFLSPITHLALKLVYKMCSLSSFPYSSLYFWISCVHHIHGKYWVSVTTWFYHTTWLFHISMAQQGYWKGRYILGFGNGLLSLLSHFNSLVNQFQWFASPFLISACPSIVYYEGRSYAGLTIRELLLSKGPNSNNIYSSFFHKIVL